MKWNKILNNTILESINKISLDQKWNIKETNEKLLNYRKLDIIEKNKNIQTKENFNFTLAVWQLLNGKSAK